MEPAQGSLLSPLIFVGFLFVFMYFMIIRPQNKRNKEIADMVAQVEKGTEIIGVGGIPVSYTHLTLPTSDLV